ncbi:hypothetical protein EJB05_54224, partial [Eragrostis curvula]
MAIKVLDSIVKLSILSQKSYFNMSLKELADWLRSRLAAKEAAVTAATSRGVRQHEEHADGIRPSTSAALLTSTLVVRSSQPPMSALQPMPTLLCTTKAGSLAAAPRCASVSLPLIAVGNKPLLAAVMRSTQIGLLVTAPSHASAHGSTTAAPARKMIHAGQVAEEHTTAPLPAAVRREHASGPRAVHCDSPSPPQVIAGHRKSKQQWTYLRIAPSMGSPELATICCFLVVNAGATLGLRIRKAREQHDVKCVIIMSQIDRSVESQQLEGDLHLKGHGKGTRTPRAWYMVQSWPSPQLEDELSRKEGWRCYGQAFGPWYCSSPGYCSGAVTVAPPFLSPPVRMPACLR